MLLRHESDRYLRAPRFIRTPEGLVLGVISWCDARAWPGHERVLRYAVHPDGTLADPIPGEPLGAVEAIGDRLAPERGDDLRDEHDGARVTIEHDDGVAEVVLETSSRRTVVWRAASTAAAPTVAAAAGGHWVAWHHDVREDTGATDVAKWIAVRFVRIDGHVFEPRQGMRGVERDRTGEEQSFEFPSLLVGPDGALSLYGRGSHNFWRQDLAHSGWSERTALSDGAWGSRGRRVAVAMLDRGRAITARREREGIVVEVVDAPTGGPPELVDALIEAPSARRDAAPDPLRAAFETQDGRRVFFGDIQQHSAHSDGLGTADEAYLRARQRYGDDFVALTDHESFLGKRTGPGEWAYLQAVADRYDEPGRFATLIAYEWTGKMYPGPGHKCVYLPARDLPLVSRDEVPEGRELVQRIKALGGIASPHHIGWTGCDEPGHDPEGQPVWEICSCHGCYEHADHPLGMRGEHVDQLADVMLRKGHRFGFTASSDSHGLLWHHGESRKRDPYRTGLTAVLTHELTREAILEALRTRRCYGTSGAKILLDMSVDGHPMGSEIRAGRAVQAWAHCAGETAVRSLELIGPSGVVASAEGVGRRAELSVRVEAAPYLYARVVQRDGEMAWGSPVFVEPGAAGDHVVDPPRHTG